MRGIIYRRATDPDGLRWWRMTASVPADDLQVPEELSRRKVGKQLLFLMGVVLVVVAVVTLLPGLDGLRARLSHANPAWLALGVGLKVLSGLGYVAIFRMVFCRRMSWRVSYQIGMSEMGANALLPTGGAGGLALGAGRSNGAGCRRPRSRGAPPPSSC